MSLPSTNSTVMACQLYPDSLTLNFRYRIPHAPFATIARVLRQSRGFRSPRNRRRVAGTLSVRFPFLPAGEEQRITVRVTRPQASAPLCIYVTLNALTALHRGRSDYAGERGRNGRVNWLHPDDVEADNTYVAEALAAMIAAVESVLSDFAHELARDLPGTGFATLEGVTVQELEVAVDMGADDPHALVRRWQPIIRRQFSHSIVNVYGGSAESYIETDGDQLLVSGFAGPDERVKLYEKTNRRVRLEVVIGSRAFRRLGLNRTLPIDDGFGFISFFEAAATRVLPHFRSLLTGSSSLHSLPADHSPIDFVANICTRTRDTAHAADLIRVLCRNGQVPSTFNRRLIRYLSEDGVLERVARGRYAVTHTYQRGLAIWRHVDEQVRGFLRRAVG